MHSLLCRLYAAMLYAYPAEFRREFGSEMRQVFRAHLRNSSESRLVFLLRTLADWAFTAAREHASAIWSAGRRARRRGPVAEWALTLLIYLFASTTLVQAYVVPTGSMEGNIKIGDHILVDRAAYANPGPGSLHLLPYGEVQRGDIVAFRYPEDPRQTYVKRVIGLPGDRIRLERKQVIRNGNRLIEPYTQHIDSFVEPYRDNFPQAASDNTTPRGRDMFANHIVGGEVVVPGGALFVLGDNRDNSEDSRYWGFVPRENMIGKPLFVYWSYEAPTDDLLEWNMRHLLDVATHFFTKTRWERTFLVPRREAALEEAPAAP